MAASAVHIAKPPRSEAASLGEQLLYGGVAIALVNAYFNSLNGHQAEYYTQAVARNPAVKDEATQAYILNMVARIEKNGRVKHHYKAYAAENKEINATCGLGRVVTINKGIIDALDEDELAFVVAHEISHGEGNHSVIGLTKSLGLGLLVDLYLSNNPNNTSYYLSLVAANWVNNEVFTMGQEWEADNKGFENAVAAGYNPGAGGAGFYKLRSKLGDNWMTGAKRVFMPNNHPKMSDRVNNFNRKMTEYSGNHVKVVGDAQVQINGVTVVAPVKTGHLLAGERAYLIAGNLARLYHDNKMQNAAVGSDGEVVIGEVTVMTPVEGEDAEKIVNDINLAIAQPNNTVIDPAPKASETVRNNINAQDKRF